MTDEYSKFWGLSDLVPQLKFHCVRKLFLMLKELYWLRTFHNLLVLFVQSYFAIPIFLSLSLKCNSWGLCTVFWFLRGQAILCCALSLSLSLSHTHRSSFLLFAKSWCNLINLVGACLLKRLKKAFLLVYNRVLCLTISYSRLKAWYEKA